MKAVNIVLLVVATLLVGSSAALATEAAVLEWAQAYGPGEGRDVTVDGADGIYVTGVAGGAWLGKYDSSGALEWTGLYGGHYYDCGHGVALDSNSNVYVSAAIGNSPNIGLLKYDMNGAPVWPAPILYEGPTGGWAVGAAVAVDKDDSIYVTGYAASDVYLRKYNANGGTIWTQTYNGPANGDDRGLGVATDASGNVYVLGETGVAGQGQNIWLRKYDTNGNTVWTQTYDNPSHSSDWGRDVAVDALGNVYVTGSSDRADLGQGDNAWVSKYDTNGNVLWTNIYDSPAHGEDVGWEITVDGAGNVYVAGSEVRDDLGQSANIWLIKYDTTGNTRWAETYNSLSNGVDRGYGVAVDANGMVYVSGESNGDVILLKYAQIPEPGTMALIAPALLGFAGVAFRKMRK